MKRIKTSLLLSLCLFTGILHAQQVTVSPIPQSITWGEKAFNNTVSFTLNGAETADKDAVALLNNKLTISASGVKITIGERGDAAVNSVEAEIPQKNEGYYLSVKPNEIIIAGADSVGTYYGVQTLLQLLASPEVMQVTVSDYPDVPERGVVEGFYGNYFTHEMRQSMFRFFGKNKMNAYMYGPKNDVYHGFGDKWREPYPPTEAAKMTQLVKSAHENKVNFIWAVHPGNNISWDDKNGDGVIDDFVACKVKFQKMYDLGVRAFAVFFDDIGGIGADPKNQAKLMNYLHKEFVQKKTDVAPLIICPTQYNQAWSGGDYLNILGTEMDKSVRIMWTGKSVVRMIDRETMQWINTRIKRNAYIWLNYPVTDYCIDHLLMGPFYGNDLDITQMYSGYLSNPMEYAEASKVALYSIADYTWNAKAFNSQQSWLNGMRFLMPDNYEAFKIFCENNVDLGSTYHGLRRDNESAPFKAVADPFWASYSAGEYDMQKANLLDAQFKSFRNSSAELLAGNTYPEMITEIKPWIQVFDFLAQKGEVLIEMFKSIVDKKPEIFIENYLKIEALDKEKNKIRSRDFPGSIKSPFPKPANEVVVPFLERLKNALVNDYRSKFDYRLDVFPETIIKDGTYFIKVNGKFLTNVRGSSYPTFVAKRDDMNPQRQEWKIAIDPETNRYSIINAEDSRYLNELGNFTVNVTTNPYEAAWHTYTLYRMNGKFAIQNGGSAGKNLWKATATRIEKGTLTEAAASTFVFEIIPINGETTEYPMVLPNETYLIKNAEKYLTNNNVGGTDGIPTFKTLNTTNTKPQEWIFTVDAASDRYKIVNAADDRFLNEFGKFSTNPYHTEWNSYLLSEIGGKHAIQNGGKSGSNYWGVFNENNSWRINKSDAKLADSYVFEIVPLSSVTSVEIVKGNRNNLKVTGNNLHLIGDPVNALRLYSLNGALVRQSSKSNQLSVSGLSAGIYILSAQAFDKKKEQFKVLIK